jgi:Reverse transcriptase (RNA-dependent DNA polymerase)
VMKHLRSFKKGTASGRSGWSVNHFLECAYPQTGVPRFLGALVSVVNLFLSGKALQSFATFMASASLVPLLKKDGSIRPIAVGEILRRLVSKCCVHAVMAAASKYLLPFQVGVGTPNGAEAILHALNRYIDRDDLPDDAVVSPVDMINVFNRVHRQAFLDSVFDRFASIFGWVQYSYGTGATLFSGSETFLATAGVQQGDPLGPLLFALVFQPLLERLHSRFGLTMVAFLDDLTLAGPAHQVALALDFLQNEGPPLGLHVSDNRSSGKTVVWSPHGWDLRATGLFGLYKCSTEEGIELLGCAVSRSPVFIDRVVSKRIDKCIASLHRMLELEDPQLCLMLLRACEGMPKLMYCWRCVSPQYLGDQATRFEVEVLAALRRILVADGPHFGSLQKRLASLPVSLGGLGIHLPSDFLRFSYCASSLSSLDIQSAILRVENLEVPSEVKGMILDYSTYVYPDAPDKASQLTKDVTSPHDNLQLFMARTYFEAEHARLLTHPYIMEKDEPTRRRFRAILDSVASSTLASTWLFALPNRGLGQRMTPLEFQMAVSLRLLMKQFEPGAMCQQNKCTACMDEYGYHALVCRGHLLPRHNLVRDALFDLLQKAKFHPVKDAPVTCLGLKQGRVAHYRPADLLIAGDDHERDCLDVTVVSPIVSTNQPVVVVGAKAELEGRHKHHKHQGPCEESGFGFLAFAIDVFGVPASESLLFLRRIVSKLVREADYPHYMASAIVFRRISIALQIGVARQLLASRKVVIYN